MSAAHPDEKMITAQELAERTGEPYDTLNHWARMGLLPYKKKGKNRFFPQKATVARCKRIRQLQNEDYNLTVIRRMLSSAKKK